MNSAFRDKLASAGIDFTRFLIGVVGALASNKNPKYADLIGQASEVLQHHLDTKAMASDGGPREIGEIQNAEVSDAPATMFHRPGSAGGASNGHHVDNAILGRGMITVDGVSVEEVPASVATEPKPVTAKKPKTDKKKTT